MKKFFLIPLMALFSCVMAWADPVTTLEGLQTALNAGGEVTLGADINAGATELAVDKDVILDLNGFTLSGAKSNGESGVIKVTGGSLTINATNGGTISAGTKLNAVCVKGGTLTINAGTFNGSYEAIYGTAGTININGGTFTTTYDNAVWAKGAALNITGGNFDGAWYDVQSDAGSVTRISGGTFAGDNDGTLAVGCYAPGPDLVVTGGTFNGTAGIGIWTGAPVIRGGSFAANPVSFVNLDSYVVTKPSTMYVVSARTGDEVAYNIGKSTTHASLSDAIDGASNGNEIYLYQNDVTAITVSKSVTIRTNGHTTNLSAGSGYARADMGQNIVFTDNAIAAFLMTDGTASLTVSENADISNAGAIHVSGNKTLTINAGVEILYKRQSAGANIIVDNGAKLTVLGSGSFKPVMHSETITVGGFTAETNATAGNQIGNRIIDVDGELVVGVKDDANNCPHFITSSLLRGSAITVNPSGVATLNNADINAAYAIIWNDGKLTINEGEYVSHASMSNGINNGTWSYGLRCGGSSSITTINGGHFVGTQGAVAVYADAIADINGGSFETVYGYNYKTGEANTKDNHYALYVARLAIVNVYGGDFKVQTPNAGSNNVVLSGNDDAYNTYGVINIYGGRYQKKAAVQAKKNGESAYPSSVPATSQWYSSFGSLAPLPVGYEYYETSDATYRYGVRAIPGANVAEVESNEPTIPWQQNTTWDADWTGGDDVVPEDNTIVTIPVGKTVVVDKNESETDAVAQQVFIAQDATLKVEDGTTLTVGEGGMNIGNGGKLIVEPGAIVKVGDAGVITTDNNALVIEATETDQAVLLYDPTVPQNENTQPKATVKLTTKSKMLNNSPFQYTYQRFALPIKAAATPVNDFDPAIHEYYDATEESYGFESYIYYWNSHNWANCNWSALVPFKGYQLANNSKNGGVVYTFKGNLIGNENGEYEFAEYGFDFFGNSYTAPINVETFLSGFGSDVEATIWLYNYTTTNWQQVSLEDFSDFGVDPQYQQIKSMDGFLLNLRAASGSANVNYNDAIWSNPLLGTTPSPAPARRAANSNISNSAVITVTEANGHGDAVTLVEKATRSNEFENGADASKYMTEDGLSLYAETNAGQLSRVATNDLSNTVLTFRAGNETNYSLTIDKAQGEDYILRDNVTGNTIAMTNGATYNFTQAANTTVPARFEVIGIAKMPTAIDNIEAAAKASGIYTVTGQFLGHDFTNLPAGVYVVNGVKIVK